MEKNSTISFLIVSHSKLSRRNNGGFELENLKYTHEEHVRTLTFATVGAGAGQPSPDMVPCVVFVT
ncbi:hypothetical protein EVAR_2964_1, partial [Eumeta japonica]